jgi:hypothetical protein
LEDYPRQRYSQTFARTPHECILQDAHSRRNEGNLPRTPGEPRGHYPPKSGSPIRGVPRRLVARHLVPAGVPPATRREGNPFAPSGPTDRQERSRADCVNLW